MEKGIEIEKQGTEIIDVIIDQNKIYRFSGDAFLSFLKKYPYVKEIQMAFAKYFVLRNHVKANTYKNRAIIYANSYDDFYNFIKGNKRHKQKIKTEKEYLEERENNIVENKKNSSQKEENNTKKIEEREISFFQWIENKQENTSKKLVNDFIEKDPKISKIKFTDLAEPSEKTKKSVKDEKEIVTETLAEIYTNQGNIKKAITIYNKLILKYPNKNTYFAKIIKNLKQNK